CLWLYLNRYFLRILAGEKGFVFMLAGLAFTWVDHCVMLAGVTAGVGVYLGQRFFLPRLRDQAEGEAPSRKSEAK
ncbi:MAG: hypothetical protein NT009_01270, partial [Proteobacteria bacterium]|nr:hypothetical protein [Pseudomonadota bacterium]